MRNSYSKKELCVLLFAFFAIIGNGYSQNVTFSNTYISSTTELAVSNFEYNFANGAAGVLGGIVGTAREKSGFLSFVGTSTYKGAGSKAHVDGYVKSYKIDNFVFPIGDNGIYRPAAISKASLTGPTDAAYYGVSASLAVTSSLKAGTDEKVLPVGGPFKIDSFDKAKISKVQDKEYWDINGTVPSKITLTWGQESEITALVKTDLKNLTIAGWDGERWVAIPSNFDLESILGTSSTVTSGSITTDAEIIPNNFNVYTLALRDCSTPISIVSTTCDGLTYSVIFTSQGVVTSNLGKVEGNNMVTGVPVGQKVVLTSKSACGVESVETVDTPPGCDLEVKVFNGLTPDDPNNENTFLYIGGIERYPENTVQIYNRWGVLVFDKKGYNNTDVVFKGLSDGRATLANAKGLTEGTYFYVINYKDVDSSNKEKSGYLYISR